MQTIFWLAFFITFLPLTLSLNLTKATVGDIQAAITSDGISCRDIIQGYLDRIIAYDRDGPNIQSIITINPRAIMDAIDLDNKYAKTNKLVGIIHCVPMIVKDNIDVAGLPTTAGLNAFRFMVPQIDSDVVANAKQAGAILIGKANMSPLADKEAWGNSETGGLARNPYNPNYTTYGSSGGNGAAGAAMFTVLGLGSETGVSINLPSSAGNLVGLRPPVPLISQNGVLPNSQVQDVIGPMAKTVQDVALLLDAMIGNTQTNVYSASSVLQKNGLSGAKLNIFQSFTYEKFDIPGMGHYEVDPQILTMFNNMVQNMIGAGAIVKNQTINMGSAMGSTLGMFIADYTSCMVSWRNQYFGNGQRYGVNAPYHSVDDVVYSKKLPPYYQPTWARQLNESSPDKCTDQITKYMAARASFIDNVLSPLLNGSDVAFWPTMPVFPPKLADDAFRRDWGSSTSPPVNMILAGSWTAYPTIDVPLGFSKPTADEPNGLPVGVILISKPENLKTLLKIAYAYQQNFGVSQVPRSVPDLYSLISPPPFPTPPPFPPPTTRSFKLNFSDIVFPHHGVG